MWASEWVPRAHWLAVSARSCYRGVTVWLPLLSMPPPLKALESAAGQPGA